MSDNVIEAKFGKKPEAKPEAAIQEVVTHDVMALGIARQLSQLFGMPIPSECALKFNQAINTIAQNAYQAGVQHGLTLQASAEHPQEDPPQ